jgi:hypothetical protein
MDRALEMDPNNCGLIDTKDMVLSKFGNYIGSISDLYRILIPNQPIPKDWEQKMKDYF